MNTKMTQAVLLHRYFTFTFMEHYFNTQKAHFFYSIKKKQSTQSIKI